MITLKVKVSDYLELETSKATVRRVTVGELNGEICVSISLIANTDSFNPNDASYLNVSNGPQSDFFSVQVLSIHYENREAKFMLSLPVNRFLFFVPPIWRDFVRDSILKLGEVAFDPKVR